MPLWEDVAMQMAEEDPRGKRKLVLAKFNCEQVCACAHLTCRGVSSKILLWGV